MNDILDTFKGMRVLVTGGTGMIGRQLVAMLDEARANTLSWRTVTASLDPIPPNWPALHFKVDLTDPTVCLSLTEGMDFVFHLAGLKGSARDTAARPNAYFIPMLLMNTNVLEACRANKVPHVLFTSSIGAYASSPRALLEDNAWLGQPMDEACWAKRMGEITVAGHAKETGAQWISVRPAAVYGPYDRLHADAMLIPSLFYRLKQGDHELVLDGDGTAIRDFIFSRDVAEGMVLAMLKGEPGGIYNLGSGLGVTVRELVETLGRIVVPSHYIFKGESSGFSRRVLDLTLAERELGFKAHTSLYDGLKETWGWCQKEAKDA